MQCHFFFLKYSYFLYPYLACLKTFNVSSNSLFSLKPPVPQQMESAHLLLNIIFLRLYLDGAIKGIGLPWWLRRYRICLQCRRPGFDSQVGKIP